MRKQDLFSGDQIQLGSVEILSDTIYKSLQAWGQPWAGFIRLKYIHINHIDWNYLSTNHRYQMQLTVQTSLNQVTKVMISVTEYNKVGAKCIVNVVQRAAKLMF